MDIADIRDKKIGVINMNQENMINELQIKACQLRKDTLAVIREMGTGWLGGSFSAADIITALFFYRVKYDPKNPQWEDFQAWR